MAGSRHHCQIVMVDTEFNSYRMTVVLKEYAGIKHINDRFVVVKFEHVNPTLGLIMKVIIGLARQSQTKRR